MTANRCRPDRTLSPGTPYETAYLTEKQNGLHVEAHVAGGGVVLWKAPGVHSPTTSSLPETR